MFFFVTNNFGFGVLEDLSVFLFCFVVSVRKSGKEENKHPVYIILMFHLKFYIGIIIYKLFYSFLLSIS